ncbi:MAG: hypothetical protein ABFD20_03285 [Anaerolineales bacterium]
MLIHSKTSAFFRLLALVSMLLTTLLAAPVVAADTGENLLSNPGFEGEFRKTDTLGTSGSSKVANDWYPWSLLGDESYNREPEYKVLRKSEIPDGFYRIYAGEQCQQFYTSYATHTSGFYQRVSATPGQTLTFSIWVQIYTGQREFSVDNHPLSDLHQPQTEATRAAGWGAGDYYAYAGIDPYGGVPASFGSAPPDTVVWSQPVLDRDTRGTDSAGHEIDRWVQLTVSTVAQADHVTVYTKGAPVYRTKHNDSFWDEASLVATMAAEATSSPTVSVATAVPTATATSTPTTSPTPSITPQPSRTPWPTDTPVPLPTATATETPLPTITPTPSRAPTIALGAALSQTPGEEVAMVVPSATPQLVSASAARGRMTVWYVALAACAVLLACWVISTRRHTD